MGALEIMFEVKGQEDPDDGVFLFFGSGLGEFRVRVCKLARDWPRVWERLEQVNKEMREDYGKDLGSDGP